MKNITLELNTNLLPIFSGTYNTGWGVTEYDDYGDELPVEYNHEDLMISIVNIYRQHEDKIINLLGIDWIKSIKFTNTWFSPREYNFKTDQLDLKLEIDKSGMLSALGGLINSFDFNKWLNENFSSRDGFMSFTPNNYKELLDQITSEGESYDQSISALIQYLGKFEDIEQDILEDWLGNGYGGLDYEIEEDEKEDNEVVHKELPGQMKLPLIE